MKKYFFLFAVAVLAGWGYAQYGGFFKQQADAHQSVSQNVEFGSFLPTLYPLEDRSFVLVVVGRNNGAFLDQLFPSLFTQKYEHFRVIYVDDASNDGSFQLASDLIYNRNSLVKADIIQHEKPLGTLACLEEAIRTCLDDEIVVLIPSHGKLAHEWVLQRLNQYYANRDLWLTYGQHCLYPSYQMGQSKPYCKEEIENQGLRSLEFRASYPQSFYAGLFKKIDHSDFLYEGQYIPIATEMAYMLPMMEMGARHMQYIPDILYLSYAAESEIDPFFAKYIASQEAYAPLDTLFSPYGEIQ